MLYFIKPENKYPISEFQHNLNPESNIRNPKSYNYLYDTVT